jgi:hypothetical protein
MGELVVNRTPIRICPLGDGWVLHVNGYLYPLPRGEATRQQKHAWLRERVRVMMSLPRPAGLP